MEHRYQDTWYNTCGSSQVLSAFLLRELRQTPATFPIIPFFLLIGTDESPGDMIGPMVGYLLARSSFRGLYRGDLTNQVHTGNVTPLVQRLVPELARHTHRMPLIIAIDAVEGDRVGLLRAGTGYIIPGEARGLLGPQVGSLHIKAVPAMCQRSFRAVPMDLVMGMAETIASVVVQVQASWESITRERHYCGAACIRD